MSIFNDFRDTGWKEPEGVRKARAKEKGGEINSARERDIWREREHIQSVRNESAG